MQVWLKAFLILDVSNFVKENIIMSYLIKDTTKQERIALIKRWVQEDESMDDSGIDLWEMYREYIDGTKEISEINSEFSQKYYEK